MNKQTHHIKLAIHGTVTQLQDGNFDYTNLHYGVDCGPLFWALSDEPDNFANQSTYDYPQGTIPKASIELQTVRSHEWEELLDIAIIAVGAGAGIFCKAALEEVAKKIVNWASKQKGLGDGSSNPTASVGDDKVEIPRNDPSSAENGFIVLLNDALKRGDRVTITIDPQSLEKSKDQSPN